ncbi:MAG: hypothetical protein R3F41_07505 [Gammaproteobacteria bacterium]|nr:hypothetical protein [Pseudomonadales bacterium]MCP5348769.1 hypothetical protein [Pseudomonadales bacterium]
MKLRGDITINGRQYREGQEVPWGFIYPFFMVHMLAFGLSGFFMAYSPEGPGAGFLYLHGGFAILIYLVFYLTLFGKEEVRWMFINAGLGLFGIYAEIGWILDRFGTTLEDYPVYIHVIPFLYYILYTFLLRQAVIDFTRSRSDPDRRRRVEKLYIGVSIALYLIILVTTRT